MPRNVVLYLCACLAVPLLFAAYIFFSYSVSLKAGMLPFIHGREWRWWAAFAVLLLVGASCIWFARGPDAKYRVLMPVIYAVIMAVALAGVHLQVACMKGDCL